MIKYRTLLVAALILAVSGAAQGVNIVTVPVGNVGNAPDSTGYGAVNYEYNIGKYEVTAGQYTEFLNAVAGVDAYGLYNTNMWSNQYGCKILRSGSSGSYTYSVAADWANRPVNYVSWGDSARFANWLHNGQPSGAQSPSTTEDGAYTLNGAMTATALQAVSRNPGWQWAIPTEDEWYKAAYHKNDGVTGNYFRYPTSSDSTPSNDLVDPDPGNNATFMFRHPDDYTIGSPYYRTEVGAHENSDSPYGTFDMAGNVWEWNEAITGSNRVIRGAAFPSLYWSIPSGGPSGGLATEEIYYTGFRVAMVPEPLTMLGVFAGIAGIGAYIRKRSRP